MTDQNCFLASCLLISLIISCYCGVIKITMLVFVGSKALMDASENMYQRYFDVVKLYNNNFIDDYCREVSNAAFAQCLAPLDNVWIMHNNYREENMDSAVVPSVRAPHLFEEDHLNGAATTMRLPSYLGRLFMVKHVCLTSHGHILTDTLKSNSSVYVTRFMTGRAGPSIFILSFACGVVNITVISCS